VKPRKTFSVERSFPFRHRADLFAKIPSKDADKEFEFVLTRKGLDWKLTEAIIPLDKIN